MNNLIRFRPANDRGRLAPGDRTGQILFFTGVRYQRMSDDTPAPQPRRARGKPQTAEAGSGRKSQR